MMNVVKRSDVVRSRLGASSAGYYRDTRVVAVVGHEGRDAGGSVVRVVVCELGQGKPLVPVVLLISAVDAHVLFQCLIDALGLSIGLWMIGRGSLALDVEFGA